MLDAGEVHERIVESGSLVGARRRRPPTRLASGRPCDRRLATLAAVVVGVLADPPCGGRTGPTWWSAPDSADFEPRAEHRPRATRWRRPPWRSCFRGGPSPVGCRRARGRVGRVRSPPGWARSSPHGASGRPVRDSIRGALARRCSSPARRDDLVDHPPPSRRAQRVQRRHAGRTDWPHSGSPRSTRPSRQSVLRGAGDAFCSGGDLDEFGSRPDPVSAHLVRLQRSAGRAMPAVADRTTVYIHGVDGRLGDRAGRLRPPGGGRPVDPAFRSPRSASG